MQNEPIEITIKVTGVLERLGIPYFIGGSLASTLYGPTRTTQDSDVIAMMRTEHIQQFIEGLRGDFYLDEELIAETIRRNSSFNIIHRETMFKVDIFIPRLRPFLESQLKRAEEQAFEFDAEVSAKFASAEDTVLAKLEWYRSGGEVSERQWRDILGVPKTQAGSLDLVYLRRWAIQLNVSDLLERAFNEIGQV